MTADQRIVVVGGGLIGSCAALGLADRGADVVLLDHPQDGSASAAAAGILAPSIEEGGALGDFGIRARDMYPAFVEMLRDRTSLDVPLDRRGVLHVATTPAAAGEMRERTSASVEWLEPAELRGLEPRLAPGHGALLAHDDGSVDNVALLSAVRRALELHSRVSIIGRRAERILGESATVTTKDGAAVVGDTVILAAGAWAGTIAGSLRASAVAPVRGQMLSYPSAPVEHVVYAPDVYLVPRANVCTLAGSTMERVGFDSRVTEEAAAGMADAAATLCAALTAPSARWAGLRPLTPDLMPLLGRDPDAPRLVYACGHSRNGVLLAPITAEIVTALIFEDILNFDLSRFDPARFGDTFPLK